METPATSPFSHRETTAMEASLGGRIHLESGYYASTTGATTLSGGFGVPAWRADLALGWAPRPAVAAGILADDPVNGDLDSDGDGVPNVADKCPGEPEDPDGFEDLDGCPDTDNDGDGIPDDQDGAPFAAEDLDGFDDADGVPDPDNDLDGVPDSEDAAPELPEDWDGVEDEDGVPER